MDYHEAFDDWQHSMRVFLVGHSLVVVLALMAFACGPFGTVKTQQENKRENKNLSRRDWREHVFTVCKSSRLCKGPAERQRVLARRVLIGWRACMQNALCSTQCVRYENPTLVR